MAKIKQTRVRIKYRKSHNRARDYTSHSSEKPRQRSRHTKKGKSIHKDDHPLSDSEII